MTAPKPEARPATSGALRLDEAVSEFEAALSAADAAEAGEPDTQEEKVKQPAEQAEPEATTEEESLEDVLGEEPTEEQDGDVPDGEEQPTKDTEVWTQSRKVKVDGEEVEVTPEEALRSYSREAHWTRRMQKLSASEKAAEAAQEAARAEREQYAARLEQVGAKLESSLPQEDWGKLRQELPPEEFAARWADHQIHLSELARVRGELETVQKRIAEDQAQQMQKHLAAEAEKLHAAIPALKDEKTRAEYQKALVEYGREVGFSDDELTAVSDHRALVILDKARQWDAHVKKVAAQKADIERKRVKATATVKPGTPGVSPPRVVTELTRSKQRLAKTGRREDAARTLELAMAAAEEG